MTGDDNHLRENAADILYAEIAAALEKANRPIVLGIAGSQGSGKTTIARKLAARLERDGRKTALLSIDDLYFDRDKRARLAKKVHPLFITRGVPGTHDVSLGVKVLRALRSQRSVRLPRFDKGTDSKIPRREWEKAPRPVDLVIFEGWCVGAVPEPKSALKEPINALERTEDADGVWRRRVNAALSGDYKRLFKLINRFVFLRAPSFDIVKAWRLQQEHELAAAAQPERLTHLMSDDEIERFIQHYERITRHMMREAPARANLTLQLNEERRVTDIIRPSRTR